MHDDKKLNFAVSCTFTQLHGRVHRMTMYVHCIAYIYAKNHFFQETVVIELEAHHLCLIFMGLNP